MLRSQRGFQLSHRTRTQQGNVSIDFSIGRVRVGSFDAFPIQKTWLGICASSLPQDN